LIDWSVGWLVDWSVDWLIDWLIDWSVDWLFGSLIDWSIDQSRKLLIYVWYRRNALNTVKYVVI
jgi:hypothetical protein